MASLLYNILKYACWHAKILKENRQSPENLTSLNRYLLATTVYWVQIPATFPIYRYQWKDGLLELEFLWLSSIAKSYQKRQGIKFPSVKNSRNLETRFTFWGPLFFPLSLPHFRKTGKLNLRRVGNWKPGWRGLRVLGRNTHTGSVSCPICTRTCTPGLVRVNVKTEL